MKFACGKSIHWTLKIASVRFVILVCGNKLLNRVMSQCMKNICEGEKSMEKGRETLSKWEIIFL